MKKPRSYRYRRVRFAIRVSVGSLVLGLAAIIMQGWASRMVNDYNRLQTDLAVSVYVFVLVMFLLSTLCALGAWVAAIFDDC